MTWLLIARTKTNVQFCGNDLLAEEQGDRQQHGGADRARKEQQGQRSQPLARPLHRDQIARVEKAGRQSEQVAVQVAKGQLGAVAHEQCRAERSQRQCRSLQRRRPAAHQPQAPGGEGEAGRVPEQGRVGELRHVNAGVPGREVGREEQGGEGNDDAERAAGPMHRLSGNPGDHEQEWQAPAPAARTPPRLARPPTAAPAKGPAPARCCRRKARRRRRDDAWADPSSQMDRLGPVLLAKLEQGEGGLRGVAALVELAPGRRGRSPAPHSRR